MERKKWRSILHVWKEKVKEVTTFFGQVVFYQDLISNILLQYQFSNLYAGKYTAKEYHRPMEY